MLRTYILTFTFAKLQVFPHLSIPIFAKSIPIFAFCYFLIYFTHAKGHICPCISGKTRPKRAKTPFPHGAGAKTPKTKVPTEKTKVLRENPKVLTEKTKVLTVRRPSAQHLRSPWHPPHSPAAQTENQPAAGKLSGGPVRAPWKNKKAALPTAEQPYPSPVRFGKYPRRESNSDLKFRKLLFYPLNYRAIFIISAAKV